MILERGISDARIKRMRYIASLLAGLGMYILAVMLWDVFGWLYLESRLRPEHFVVAQAVFRVGSKWDDFYAMLPMIMGHAIPISCRRFQSESVSSSQLLG